MPLPYYLNVSAHVLAALFWLGGMFFLAVVGAPALRAIDSPALRQQLFQALGVRFRAASWVAIVVLLVTGVLNLHFRGWLHGAVLGNSAFWRTSVGHTLAWKLVAVTAMVVGSAVHDFAIGPAAGRAAPGSPTALRLRRRASVIARVNALLGLIVVLAAVRLARGG